MAEDSYRNFKELANHEKPSEDYDIIICDTGSPITIIAPHGGKIEPKTSYIAGRIAGDKFNLYCFEGIKPNNNRCLHITSHKFDEPRAIELITGSRVVVTIHACTERAARVYPGGRDDELIAIITKALKAVGIAVAERNSKYPGLNPNNICNRGATGRGVQLEISRGLRDDLDKVQILCDAIQAALARLKV